MARPPISSQVHGILDYVNGVTLVAAPEVLGLRGTRAGRILRIAGAGHAGLAALTRYELGVIKVVPYQAHLAADAVGAVALTASPWLFGTADHGRRHWLPHVLFGVWEMVVTGLSDPSGRGMSASEAAGGESQPSDTDEQPQRSGTGERQTVFPEGAEASRELRGAVGERPGGGIGSGTGPGNDPPIGGLQR